MADWAEKFKAYTTKSLVGQIRMDARYAFMPEDEAYLSEIAARMTDLQSEVDRLREDVSRLRIVERNYRDLIDQ
jgi:hypothetical protein